MAAGWDHRNPGSSRVVEKQIKYLDEIGKWSSTIKSNSEKIGDRARRMRSDLEKEVARLDENLSALRTTVDPQ